MPHPEWGARDIWAKPYGRCPVRFIEIICNSYHIVVATCQRTCKPKAKWKFTFGLCWGAAVFRGKASKIARQNIVVQSEIQNIKHSPRLHPQLCRSTTEQTCLVGISFHLLFNFCDSGFLICGGKDMKISRYLPRKYREICHFKIIFNISSRAKK